MATPKAFNASELYAIYESINRAEESKKASPIHFYDPNQGCQQEFHKSQALFRVISGANSSGKSYCSLGAEVGYHCTEGEDVEGNATGYAIHPYRKIRIPTIGAISSPTEEVQSRTEGGTQSYFLQFLEKDMVDKQQERGALKKAFLRNGSIVEFITDASGRQAYQSATFNWIALDEPHTPAVIGECQARLIRKLHSRIWWAFTPAYDPKVRTSVENVQWAIKNIVRPAVLKQNKGEKHESIEVWFMPIDENKDNIDWEGALKVFASMSKEERQIRMTGRYVELLLSSGFNLEMLEVLESQAYDPREGALAVSSAGNMIVFNEGGSQYYPEFRQGHIHRFWGFPEKGHRYAIGVDPGGVSDPTSATVIDVDRHAIVAEFHGWVEELELSYYLWLLGVYYNNAMLAIECNKEGKVTVAYLHQGNSDLGIVRYDNLYMRPMPAMLGRGFDVPSYEPGWLTTAGARGTRELLIGDIRMFFAKTSNLLKQPGVATHCPSWYHIEEAMTFSPNIQGKLEAESGKNDDRIISLGIALQAAKRIDSTHFTDDGTGAPKKEVPLLMARNGNVVVDFQNEDNTMKDSQRRHFAP